MGIKWAWYLFLAQLAEVALRVTLWESLDLKSAFRGEVSGCGLVGKAQGGEVSGCGLVGRYR